MTEQCNLCDKELCSNWKLNNHIASKNGGEKELNQRRTKSNIFGIVLASKESLRNHMTTKHTNRH